MAPKYTYRVRPIDIDGDGIPDGSLVEKLLNGAVVNRKFVTDAKMSKVVKFVTDAKMSKVVKSIPVTKTVNVPKKSVERPRVVYPDKKIEIAEQQPVLVADKTSLGQSLKSGFGLGLGLAASEALFDGVANFF
jgi:hypothetical protein